MNSKLIAAGALAALLIPGLAAAQNAPSQPAARPAAANNNPVICRYYYYNGNVIRRPECRTAHEWERMRYQTQYNLIRYQTQSLDSD